MTEINIRPANSTDIPKMVSVDHNYATGHVWQMTLDLTDIQTQVSFREVRLPREVHVNYPRITRKLVDDWTKLAVDRIIRRNGIGSALVLAAQDWCGKKGIHRLTLEMQPKNYPAIQFAYKLGFEFSGYNDQYYRDQEIAIFFSSYI